MFALVVYQQFIAEYQSNFRSFPSYLPTGGTHAYEFNQPITTDLIFSEGPVRRSRRRIVSWRTCRTPGHTASAIQHRDASCVCMPNRNCRVRAYKACGLYVRRKVAAMRSQKKGKPLLALPVFSCFCKIHTPDARMLRLRYFLLFFCHHALFSRFSFSSP